MTSVDFPAWPVYGPEEMQQLEEVFHQGVWSAADGPKVRRLEERFAAFHGAHHGVAVTNGTVSLEIALAALDVGAGYEVIVPAYTFLATASAVLAVNALPIFVDIDPATYCVDPAAVEDAITDRTRAIIPVHLGGHPADMSRLADIASNHDLRVIEDAAQAHGASWQGRRVGSWGDYGSFSFQASKNMTAGEGGMLTTNDQALAELAWSLHNCGRQPTGPWYEHYVQGANNRLTEFQAGLLLAQFDRLPDQIKRREATAALLDEHLGAFEGLLPAPRTEAVTTHAYHLYAFRYRPSGFGGASRDNFISALGEEGIPISPAYPVPLYRQPAFLNRAFDLDATGYDPGYPPTRFDELYLPMTEEACRDTVWFPQHVLLGDETHVERIVKAVHRFRDRLTV